MTDSKVQLGNSEVFVSPMGLGTMQFGDVKIKTKTNSDIDKDIHEAYKASLDAGINFFDTAEMYGNGRSEIYLGRYLKQRNDIVTVATKFMPFPWRLTRSELRTALVQSLNRLELNQVDLYQMHWPFPPVPIPSWMEAMADAIYDGLIRAVGVSNYSLSQTTIAFEALAKHHIPLASNQVKYSLLDRRPERSGLLELCIKLGVKIIAYSPLEKGMLTGKYNKDNLPAGIRSWRYNKTFMIKIKPIINALREIGMAQNSKTPGQVALNWLMCKGAIPIPGARNKQQAIDNAGALGWQLSNEEVLRLDRISDEIAP